MSVYARAVAASVDSEEESQRIEARISTVKLLELDDAAHKDIAGSKSRIADALQAAESDVRYLAIAPGADGFVDFGDGCYQLRVLYSVGNLVVSHTTLDRRGDQETHLELVGAHSRHAWGTGMYYEGPIHSLEEAGDLIRVRKAYNFEAMLVVQQLGFQPLLEQDLGFPPSGLSVGDRAVASVNEDSYLYKRGKRRAETDMLMKLDDAVHEQYPNLRSRVAAALEVPVTTIRYLGMPKGGDGLSQLPGWSMARVLCVADDLIVAVTQYPTSAEPELELVGVGSDGRTTFQGPFSSLSEAGGLIRVRTAYSFDAHNAAEALDAAGALPVKALSKVGVSASDHGAALAL